MAFNLGVFRGVTIQQVRDTMNYKQYLKTDDDVEGIRVKPDDNTSPVLLSVVVHNEDERKSDPIQ
jgi:hypothetical protein